MKKLCTSNKINKQNGLSNVFLLEKYKPKITQIKFLLLVLFFSVTSNGQNLKIIEVDPITDLPKETIPFDQGFVLKKVYNEPIDIISIGYFEIKRSQMKTYFDDVQIAENSNLKYKFIKIAANYELYIFVPPLKAQRYYDFIIASHLMKSDNILIDKYLELFELIYANKNVNASAKLDEINQFKNSRLDPFKHINIITGTNELPKMIVFFNAKIKSILDGAYNNDIKKQKIIEELCKSDDFTAGYDFLSTTKIFNFETRTQYTITPDFGYVYYGFQNDFSGITPYVGFQIELRYFDKNIPFNLIPNRTIWHRLSFNSGITLASLKKDGRREDLFANKSLLVGMGYRFSNAIRLTGGAILFNKEATNPLLENKKLSVTPFIGISIDLSIKKMLTDFSSLIPIKRN